MAAGLLRYFSCLFHGVLALVMLLASGVALLSNPNSLRIDVLPWTGGTLTYVVFFSALFGLISVILALMNRLPWLLLIWSIVVPALLIWGYLFTKYGFSPGEMTTASMLVASSLIAVTGPVLQLRRRS